MIVLKSFLEITEKDTIVSEMMDSHSVGNIPKEFSQYHQKSLFWGRLDAKSFMCLFPKQIVIRK